MAFNKKTWKNDSSTPLNDVGLNDLEGRIGNEFSVVSNALDNIDLSMGAITFNRGTTLGTGTLSNNTKLYQKGNHVSVSESGTRAINTEGIYLVNVSLWLNCEGTIPSNSRIWLSIRQNSDLYEYIDYAQTNEKYKSIDFTTVLKLGTGNMSLYSKTDGFSTTPIVGVGSPVISSKMSVIKI